MEWMEENGIKEVDVKTEGITADHVWWHGDILARKMSGWTAEFKRLVQTMEDRHKEHLKMIAELLEERKQLNARRISEQEAVVIYNELQEVESLLYNLIKINTDIDDYQFVEMTSFEVEQQISMAVDKLKQLCVRLEAKE